VKVLLDENWTIGFASTSVSHEVFTASFMGWNGFKNGMLLQTAQDDGFDVLVTG
jgi:hypothetical protein